MNRSQHSTFYNDPVLAMMVPRDTFRDFNRLFFQSITFGVPLVTLIWLPTRHRSQHKMNRSQHSTFYNDPVLAMMVPRDTFRDFNRLFFQSITFGVPLVTLIWLPTRHRSQHKMNRSQHSTFYNDPVLTMMVPVSRFMISIAYFFKVSPSAPPWQLLPDSPPYIQHSTAQDESFTAQHFLE